MKLKRGVSVLLVLACGLVLWGCSRSTHPRVELFTSYYINTLVPYAFMYTDEATQEIHTFSMANDDHSFLEFGENWQSMRIVFVTGDQGTVDFVVTSSTRSGGNIEGTASRLQNAGPDMGRIIRYSFWSTSTTIYLRALVSYRVLTATRTPEDDSEAHRVVTVARDTIVASFHRTAPGWIGGGA